MADDAAKRKAVSDIVKRAQEKRKYATMPNVTAEGSTDQLDHTEVHATGEHDIAAVVASADAPENTKQALSDSELAAKSQERIEELEIQKEIERIQAASPTPVRVGSARPGRGGLIDGKPPAPSPEVLGKIDDNIPKIPLGSELQNQESSEDASAPSVTSRPTSPVPSPPSSPRASTAVPLSVPSPIKRPAGPPGGRGGPGSGGPGGPSGQGGPPRPGSAGRAGAPRGGRGRGGPGPGGFPAGAPGARPSSPPPNGAIQRAATSPNVKNPRAPAHNTFSGVGSKDLTKSLDSLSEDPSGETGKAGFDSSSTRVRSSARHAKGGEETQMEPARPNAPPTLLSAPPTPSSPPPAPSRSSVLPPSRSSTQLIGVNSPVCFSRLLYTDILVNAKNQVHKTPKCRTENIHKDKGGPISSRYHTLNII